MPKFKPQYRRLLFIDRKIKEGSYSQHTRQASIRKDTLKFGGFLFFRRAA
jgi:hypothetical protein